MAKKINIKKLRKEMGLRQAAFAERLGINQSTVSRLEAGVMVPRGPLLKVLEGLTAALNERA